MKEGTVIGNDMMHYGGFPKIKEINEEGLRPDIDPDYKAWYLKSLELGKAMKEAKRSGDPAKIKTARAAYQAHRSKVPMRKEPHPHKSDFGTYHPSTNIDSSREGT